MDLFPVGDAGRVHAGQQAGRGGFGVALDSGDLPGEEQARNVLELERLDFEGELATPAENEIVWSTEQYASGLYIGRLEARGADGGSQVAFVRMAVSQ